MPTHTLDHTKNKSLMLGLIQSETQNADEEAEKIIWKI
jgi:hypothetical protein